MSELGAIGFPAPLLGDASVRLPVWFVGGGLVALGKPPGVGVDAHPLELGVPTLVAALAAQCEAGKPELKAFGIESPYGVYHLDAALSGIALIACDKDSAAHFRNVYGSAQMRFTYQFLARGQPREGDKFICELPLAVHSHENRMLVSHKTGKQAVTEFRRLKNYGEWCMWEATTNYPRLHQIRVHTMEHRLQIMGEDLYAEVPLIYLSSLKKKRYLGRDQEKPLYAALALHLATVEVEGIRIEAPLPRKFSVLLNKLLDFYS